MADYSTGKIYKITCLETDEVYYGSTTQELSRRVRKGSYNTSCKAYNIIKRNNYQEEIVEEYPCDNKIELETRERWWIENNLCVNKVIPTQTKSEYYESNKEKKIEDQKQYQKDNYETSRSSIKKWQEEEMICECGKKIQRQSLYRHIKSKKHQDFILNHNYNVPCRHQK